MCQSKCSHLCPQIGRNMCIPPVHLSTGSALTKFPLGNKQITPGSKMQEGFKTSEQNVL